MDRQLGLIGHPLKHSFSKKYFSKKFEKNGIDGFQYELYDLEKIEDIENTFKVSGLLGLNVTIPYKEAVIPYLDELDLSAKKVGAVNVIKLTSDNRKIGFNSDYYGFKNSLKHWIPNQTIKNALILGTGGASKAVKVALKDLEIKTETVSRSLDKANYSYDTIRDQSIIDKFQLIINTTPLGTSPNISEAPDIPYHMLSEQHYLYDLIYNPDKTLFMKKGAEQGAHVKNGYEMLVLQAERSWEIWNT